MPPLRATTNAVIRFGGSGRRLTKAGWNRGQSLVEFALLLPLLLIIVLGVVDFGRVFQTGIVMESAARAAAEAGAIEYLREVTGKDPTYVPDYDRIREVAAQIACREASRLPNSDSTCSEWPIIRVCIHDEAAGDPDCGGPAAVGSGSVPADCPATDGGWSAASALPVADTDANPDPRAAYVEVRTCYRFTTLIPTNDFLPIGVVHLQKNSVFTVADY
jgi:TadE-like protein